MRFEESEGTRFLGLMGLRFERIERGKRKGAAR